MKLKCEIMKYLKSTKSHFFIFLFASTILLVSCKKAESPTINPTKVCNTGYYGSSCSTTFNSAYVTASGVLSETCTPSGAAGPYTSIITANPSNPLEFTITGIWSSSTFHVICNINPSDRNSFTASRQPLNASFDIVINSGTLSSDGTLITYHYSIYTTGSTVISDGCTGTIHR